MSAKSRKEVLEQARQRYSKRGREGRSRLLDEVCELCGYERKYVIKVLGGKRAIVGSRKRGGSQAIYRGGGTRGHQSQWLAAERDPWRGRRGGATVLVAALREAQRALGSGFEAKSARNKCLEH